MNLVGNAVKFTDHGEIVLDVGCHMSDEDNIEIRVQVRDTGIGIPPEKINRIFDAFEQVDTSTTRRYGGTGLGLTITSRLVSLMGGTIWVESLPGRGSTFFFTARLRIANAEAWSPNGPLIAQLQGTRVLIVDDNATNRLILAEILEQHHLESESVTSAAEAIQALRRSREEGRPFALILTDVNMPDVDGFMLVEQIRNDQRLVGLPVIVLTSGDRLGDHQRCERLKIAAHLRKPIKQSELMQSLVMALGFARPEPELVRHNVVQSAVPSLQILLVEDSYPNQVLATGLLRKRGHRVTVANHGQEAIDALKSDSFDLVLMDVQMPVLDGLEATRIIRRMEVRDGLHPECRNPIPIVAMTAHAMKGDRERCLESGMNGYLTKPIRTSELDETLDEFFSKERLQQNVPSIPSNDAIDWSAALASVDGDIDLLRGVVEAVLHEIGDHLAALSQAVSTGDAPEVQRIGHLLKGILGTIGAKPSAELAAKLEQLGSHADLGSASDYLNPLQKQVRELSVLLIAFVQGQVDIHQ